MDAFYAVCPVSLNTHCIDFCIMSSVLLFQVALVLLFSCAAAYRNDLQPVLNQHDAPEVDCHENPHPMSWHVHITYMLTSPAQIAAAGLLRTKALTEFAELLGPHPECQGTEEDRSGRYDNGRLCAIYDHSLNTTLGPFPVGEWSFFVPVHYFSTIVPWFTQNRGDFTLLVHPNSGCEYEDHSIWAQWTGPAWNLDLSIFTPWTQTESFGQYLGSPENPVCLRQGGICADKTARAQYSAAAFAPQVVCCAGLACGCEDEGNCYCR